MLPNQVLTWFLPELVPFHTFRCGLILPVHSLPQSTATAGAQFQPLLNFRITVGVFCRSPTSSQPQFLIIRRQVGRPISFLDPVTRVGSQQRQTADTFPQLQSWSRKSRVGLCRSSCTGRGCMPLLNCPIVVGVFCRSPKSSQPQSSSCDHPSASRTTALKVHSSFFDHNSDRSNDAL